MIPGLAATLIDAETNSLRFENFCMELFERVERTRFVPTSVTYDRGRDARTIGSARGSHAGILCATLNKEIDSKIEKDLERVTATSSPDRLIYCSSQPLTEDKIDQIAAQIKRAIPHDCSVLVVGAIQIAKLSEDKNLDLVEKFYGPEIHAIETAINAFEKPSEASENPGLKLALVAFSSEDAVALRQSLLRHLILEGLRVTGGKPPEIAGKVSKDLCLPRPISTDYVVRTLEQMRKDGLAKCEKDHWVITEEGSKAMSAVPPQAAKELLAGRTVIREKLQELIGFSVADKQYEMIWSTLLDFLSELFHSNGLETIRAVNEFIDPQNDGSSNACVDLSSLLSRGAHKISLVTTETGLGETLKQAIMDLFTERTGAAFEWLSRVCERFVSLCALGLEAKSADEINAIVRKNHIVLDSHIIISLLCESDAAHVGARSLITRWRRAGGKLLLARPVLEEVAHHAWISQNDFENTKFLLGKLGKHELRRYVGNAFVSAFHFHSKKETDASNWPMYINQFRGREPNDYSNLLPLLQHELGADVLPDKADSDLEEKMCNYVLDITAEYQHVAVEALDKAEIGKAKTDAHLLASIAANSDSYKKMGNEASIVLLTSSGRARRTHLKFREYLGPRTILTTGTFSYLLSMTPDAQLGAGTLRGALFDFGETAHLQDSERLALRIIRGVGKFDFPWARRRSLERNLEELLHKEAAKRDIPVRVYREQFEQGVPSANSAEVIVEAVKAVALQDSTSKELSQAHLKIRDLEDDVDNLRARVAELRQAGKERKKGRSS